MSHLGWNNAAPGQNCQSDIKVKRYGVTAASGNTFKWLSVYRSPSQTLRHDVWSSSHPRSTTTSLIGTGVKQYSIHSALEWQAGVLSGAHSTAHTTTSHSILWENLLSSDSICLDLFYLRSAISSFEWRWGSFLINTHSGLPGLWNSKASSILQSACVRIRHRSPLRLAGPFHKLLIETIIK